MAKLSDNEMRDRFSKAFRELQDPHMVVLERTWLRNILYYLGEQWLSWLRQNGTFGRRHDVAYGVPTPVSNIIRDTTKSLIAMIMNKKHIVAVWPNSNDQKDKDASELGGKFLTWLDKRNDEELEGTKEIIAMWTILTGNGFGRTFGDINDGGIYLMDKGGNSLKKGDVVSEALLPFNVTVPSLGVRIREKIYVGIKSLRNREWVEDSFKIKLSKTAADVRQVDYQRQLLSLVANVSPWKGAGIEGDMLNSESEDLVVFKELELKPSKAHPKGQYYALAGSEIVVKEDSMPIPVDKDGNWSYTVDHFQYNLTPGGFWSSSAIDDLISPQNIINEVDQSLSINRQSLGRPYILTPTELTLKRLSEHGQGLLQIQYDGQHAGGAKAQIMPGVPYPQQVLEERRIHREVAQEVAGDPRNVLRGKAPYAGAPGIAIDILRETAEQGHAPDVARFYRAWKSLKHKQLIVASHIYTENRMIKIQGRGNEVKVKAFKGADLMGNLDVQLELDSGISTTNRGKNEFLMQLIQYKFWDEQNGPKPDVRREMLNRFGLSGFPEASNIHRDRAEYENSLIIGSDNPEEAELEGIALPPIPTGEKDPETGEELNTEATNDPIFELDDHGAHIEVHDQKIFSREFRALRDFQKMALITHRQYHAERLVEQLAKEQELLAGAEEQGNQPDEGGEDFGGGGDVGEEFTAGDQF